ncbi:hypothetical protein GUJ93_ZPchr0002g24621 [Zizania palustris]|uniref:Uncharacterized protein n=1 Tax=Zizania palustris TaxID=103762 RepID=A0A8J5RV93_ZIZPA|nr:hypothetical protein GUJ93_ZPchr0002g24621 [Zizania palustris]
MFILLPLFPSSRDSSRGPLLRASLVRHRGARLRPSSSPLVAALSLPLITACSATVARRGISSAVLVAFRHQPPCRRGGAVLRRGPPSPAVVAGRLVSTVVETWRPLRPSPPSRRSFSSRVALSPPLRRLLRPSPPLWRSLPRVALSPPSRRPLAAGSGRRPPDLVVGRQIWAFPSSSPPELRCPSRLVFRCRVRRPCGLLRLRLTVRLVSAAGVALSGPFPPSRSSAVRRSTPSSSSAASCGRILWQCAESRRRPSDLGVSPSSAASRGSPPAVAGVLPSAVIAACLGRLSPPPPVGSASAVRHRLLRCLPPGRLVLTSCRRRGGLLRRLGSGVVFFIGSPSLQDLISAVAGWSSCTVGCWLIPVTRVQLCHPR